MAHSKVRRVMVKRTSACGSPKALLDQATDLSGLPLAEAPDFHERDHDSTTSIRVGWERLERGIDNWTPAGADAP